jgi:hypothetical protein
MQILENSRCIAREKPEINIEGLNKENQQHIKNQSQTTKDTNEPI